MPTVTGDRTAAERKRRQRQRERAAADVQAPLLFERADWQLFLRRETLPQKAGCEPAEIGRIVLKELVDNALDTGSDDLIIEEMLGGWRVTDHGPGIATSAVPKLFAVNRPLLSSKLKRLPLRGMLGNGLRVVMGAVAAFDGTISVTSRPPAGAGDRQHHRHDKRYQRYPCPRSRRHDGRDHAEGVRRVGRAPRQAGADRCPQRHALHRPVTAGVVRPGRSARAVRAGHPRDNHGRPYRARRVRSDDRG